MGAGQKRDKFRHLAGSKRVMTPLSRWCLWELVRVYGLGRGMVGGCGRDNWGMVGVLYRDKSGQY